MTKQKAQEIAWACNANAEDGEAYEVLPTRTAEPDEPVWYVRVSHPDGGHFEL